MWNKIKKHKDKVLHFLGCAIGVFIISRFMHMDYAVFGVLMFAIGVEIGDLKNYGIKELKSKDKTRIQKYLVNTIWDLIADVFGILMVALIMGIILVLGVRHGIF
jgi:CDP-diglyceride synthetase